MSITSRINKLFALAAVYSSEVFGDYTINMPVGVTEISHKIHQLHMTIFWICVVIGAIVFSVMFYAIIFHRKSIGHQAAQFGP
jgi:cytochrome c oxidase subunit II